MLGCDWHTGGRRGRLRRSVDRSPGPFRRATGPTLRDRSGGRGKVPASRPRPCQRKGDEPTRWLLARGEEWLYHVRSGTLDLSVTYRSVFERSCPRPNWSSTSSTSSHMTMKLDQCRRHVQNETLGHRGRRDDHLYRIRRCLAMAAERLDEEDNEKMLGVLRRITDKRWCANSTASTTTTSASFIDELL
jgi:hypothetical protein